MKLIFPNFYQVLSLCILIRQVVHQMLISTMEVAAALTDIHARNNWDCQILVYTFPKCERCSQQFGENKLMINVVNIIMFLMSLSPTCHSWRSCHLQWSKFAKISHVFLIHVQYAKVKHLINISSHTHNWSKVCQWTYFN